MVSKAELKQAIIAGFGGSLGIATLILLSELTPDYLWVMAPFGATVVLLFALPDAPLSQPRNIVAGHFLTALIGLIFLSLFGAGIISLSLATGVAITIMLVTKTTHPPAGANPLLIILTGQSWSFLIAPVLIGAITLVIIGKLFHSQIAKAGYPKQWT